MPCFQRINIAQSPDNAGSAHPWLCSNISQLVTDTLTIPIRGGVGLSANPPSQFDIPFRGCSVYTIDLMYEFTED